MAEQASGGRTWADVLLTGVGGLIDSQIARNYAVADPTYNTAGGRGGQAQQTLQSRIASNPLPWIIGAVAVVALIAVARR